MPEVRFLGEPSALFPRPWSVVSWLHGETPGEMDAMQQSRLAAALGPFVRRLHQMDTSGLKSGSERWGYRSGEPVTDVIDGWAHSAALDLETLFDTAQVERAWRRVRAVPPASTRACWVHTDLSAENMLASPEGDLVGVLDFGGLGVGDRSVDLLYAWSMFDPPARDVLRREADADDATWLRARAWAFVGPGLLTKANYRHSMPDRTARLTRMVERIASEVGVDLR